MKMKYDGNIINFVEYDNYNALLDYLDESNPDRNDKIEWLAHADIEPVGIDYDDLYCYEFVLIKRDFSDEMNYVYEFATYPAQIYSMFDIKPITVVEYEYGYPVNLPAWLIKKPFARIDESYITFNDSITKCENLVELFELIKDDTITGDMVDYDADANLFIMKEE